MQTYVRVDPTDQAPERLLDPEQQRSEPWSEDGLYRYMLKRDADPDGCRLVELEGEESPDEDFDADEGALLIRPTRVVDTRPLDHERIEALRRQLAASDV